MVSVVWTRTRKGRFVSGAAALALGCAAGWATQPGDGGGVRRRMRSVAHAAAPPTATTATATATATTTTTDTDTHRGTAGGAPFPELPSPAPRDGLGSQFRDGLIMTGSTKHRLILFTFDDGPDRNTTPPLLDRLDVEGVRAVFFLTGRRIRGENLAERQQQEIARETVRRGHLVASHTLTHAQLPLLTDTEALKEITATERVFQKVLGGRPWLFRPPGGAHSDRIDRLLAERGYTTVLWNLGSGDFQVRTAEDVYRTWRRVFERRKREGDRGGIILLHDTHAWSVEAFSMIMDHLMRENCTLLAQGEELYDVVDDPRYFFAPRTGQPGEALAPRATVAPDILEARQQDLRLETQQRCATLAMR